MAALARTAFTGSLRAFMECIESGRFFTALADLDQARSKALWPWLRLIRTADLERWMFGAGAEIVLPHLEVGDPTYLPVAKCLLERHLLHLSERRDPTPLLRFWRQLLPERLHGLADLWEELDLPATLKPHSVHEQEALFAHRLEEARARLQAPLPWAAQLLQRLAEGRGPAQRRAGDPIAQVVFAWTGATPLRPGALVRFRLLAECEGAAESLATPQLFDATFHSALEEVRKRLGMQQLRILWHDWDFLGQPGVLGDASGFVALWLTQWLAGGGRELREQSWVLPTWLVASASPAADDTAPAPAGLLDVKCAQLIEEGVRVLLVADEDAGEDFSASTALEEGVNVPGAEDLRVVRFRGGASSIFRLLERHGWVWPARNPPARGRLFGDHSPSGLADHASDRSQVVSYRRPDYALARLAEATMQLGERGYLHFLAPPMWGKTELARYLEGGPEDATYPLGVAIRYRVLHGVCEEPTAFLTHFTGQCQRKVGDALDLSLFDPSTCTTAVQARQCLTAVFHATVDNLEQKKLLVVIDGLDELTEEEGSTRCNLLDILPRPRELPQGCFVLLLSRPDLRVDVRETLARMRAEGTVSEVSFSTDEDDYWDLLRSYTLERLGPAASPHLDTILQRSSNKFLYLRLLCGLLQDQNLSSVSPGDWPNLGRVIPQYLAQLATRVPGGECMFAAWHRPVLLLIAAAFEPIGRAHLRRWLPFTWDEEARDRLDRVLEDLADAGLVSAEYRAILPDDAVFVVGHPEVATWLLQNNDPSWQHAVVTEGHQRIASADITPAGPDEAADQVARYHRYHLASHWLAAGNIDPARPDQAAELVRSMITQADAFAEQQLHERAAAGFQEALVRLERLADLFGGLAGLAVEVPEVVRLWVKACASLARAASEQGDDDQVVQVSRRGLALAAECGDVAETSDVRGLYNHLALAHDRRATALIREDPLAAAVEEFGCSVEAGERLLECLRGESLPDDVELTHRLARVYLHQARLAIRCCRPEAAESACSRALSLLAVPGPGSPREPELVLQILALERKALLLMERVPDYQRAVDRAIRVVATMARDLRTEFDTAEVRAEVGDLNRTVESVSADTEHFSEAVRRSVEEHWQPVREMFRL